MIALRDYQIPAVDFLCQRQHAAVQAPAGSGKTVIGAVALAKVLPSDTLTQGPLGDVFWIGNTVEQCQQAHAALTAALGYDAQKQVEICCWQASPNTERASIIIIDECHHAPAKVLKDIIGRAPPNCRIWGLSATPFGSDPERNIIMLDIFRELYTVDRKELVSSGQIARARVVMLTVNRKNEFVGQVAEDAKPDLEKRLNRLKFLKTEKTMDVYKAKAAEAKNRAMFSWAQNSSVLMNRARNRKTVEVATEHILNEDTVLVLVGQVIHAKALAGVIPGAVAVFSGMGLKKRKAALQGFNSGAVRCVVATSLADEGLDVPRANVLVLVAGGRSANKLEQRTGRVLRAFAGKSHGMIYDFDDVGHPMTAGQSKARMRTYKRLGYEIEAQ